MAFDGRPRAGQDPDALQKRGRKALMKAQSAFKVHQQYMQRYQDCAEIFCPERADFTTKRSPSDDRYEGVFTSAPQVMFRDLAHKLGSVIRPRGRNWFRATTRPQMLMDDHDVRVWCENATRVTRNIIYEPQANFTSEMRQSDYDFVLIGWSVVAHPYNSTETGLSFRALHPRDCAWTSNADGHVDTMYTKMKMSLRNYAMIFGSDKLPSKWRDRLKDHGEEEHVVYRCVCPIDYNDRSPSEMIWNKARYTALYVCEDGDMNDGTIAEGFFLTFPFTVRQWLKSQGEAYPVSPVTSVGLADARTLNSAQETLLSAMELRTNPPKWLMAGAIRGEFDLRAGGITVVDDEYDVRTGDPIKALEIGEPGYGIEFREALLMDLGSAFFEKVLKWLPDREMTAFEVGERLEMYATEAAPIFEPMEADNSRMLDSIFVQSMEKGAYGAVLDGGQIDGLPEAMKMGASVEFEFETPLSDAMRKLQVRQGDEIILRAQSILNTGHPDAIASLDNLNWDQIKRDMSEGIGPQRWLHNPDDVQKKRIAAAQAAQAQAEQEAALAATEIASKANPENMKMMDREMKEQAGV